VCLPALLIFVECQQADGSPVVIFRAKAAQVGDEKIVLLILIQVDAFNMGRMIEFCQWFELRLSSIKSNTAYHSRTHVGE